MYPAAICRLAPDRAGMSALAPDDMKSQLNTRDRRPDPVRVLRSGGGAAANCLAFAALFVYRVCNLADDLVRRVPRLWVRKKLARRPSRAGEPVAPAAAPAAR